MQPDADITRFAIEAGDLVAPIIGGLVAIGIIIAARSFVSSFVAQRIFRQEGYELYQTVELDDQKAVITHMGMWSVHFLVFNGPHGFKFRAVRNTRLAWANISRLVRRYPEEVS